jgi:hypothetical protein
MMSFLQGYGLWLWQTLVGIIYLTVVLLFVCGPFILVYAVLHLLARLLVRVRDGGPGQTGRR